MIEKPRLLSITGRVFIQMMKMKKVVSFWVRFWMFFSGTDLLARVVTRLVGWPAPPFYGRCYLSTLSGKGNFSSSATIYHKNVHFGPTYGYSIF